MMAANRETVNVSGPALIIIQLVLSPEEPYAQITKLALTKLVFVSQSLVTPIMPTLNVSTRTSAKLLLVTLRDSVPLVTKAFPLQLAQLDTAPTDSVPCAKLIKSAKPSTQKVIGATKILVHAMTLILSALEQITLHAKLQTT